MGQPYGPERQVGLDQVVFGRGDTYKRAIFIHHKHLNKGDHLIDDRTKTVRIGFEKELIQFGSDRFPDWKAVLEYLL